MVNLRPDIPHFVDVLDMYNDPGLMFLLVLYGATNHEYRAVPRYMEIYYVLPWTLNHSIYP